MTPSRPLSWANRISDLDVAVASHLTSVPMCDKHLDPSVLGAYYRLHVVQGKRAHVITLNLKNNSKIRLRAYYDGSAHRLEGSQAGQNSWWNLFGKTSNALAVVSGTFFDYGYPGATGKKPFGDVVGAQQTWDATNAGWKRTYDGKDILIKDLHRCYVGFHKVQKSFKIGYRSPQTTLAGIQTSFDDFIGGFGWLVYHGQNAVDVSRAHYDAVLVKDNKKLFGQEYQDDVYAANYSAAAAVDETGKHIAVVVTEAGWTPQALSDWFRSKNELPFAVYNACFFDRGGTAEMYLPKDVDKAHQKKPEKDWGKIGERPQPSCWMVGQIP